MQATDIGHNGRPSLAYKRTWVNLDGCPTFPHSTRWIAKKIWLVYLSEDYPYCPNKTQMAYSEYELAEATSTARTDASYFRGLDWANNDGKRGRLVTPWQEHCPKCWEGLSEVTRKLRGLQYLEEENRSWSRVLEKLLLKIV